MIDPSTNKIDPRIPLDPIKAQTSRASGGSVTPVPSDKFSNTKTEQLLQILEANPAVRPEVVQRAQSIASNPDYPPPEVARKISEMILASADPADQQD